MDYNIKSKLGMSLYTPVFPAIYVSKQNTVECIFLFVASQWLVKYYKNVCWNAGFIAKQYFFPSLVFLCI